MLIDTTLREGAQMFGVRMGLEDRQTVVMGLSGMGVDEIEVGWAGLEELEALCRWSGRKLGGSAISVWSRCRESDVIEAARIGAGRINIGVPASDDHRRKRLDISRRALTGRMKAVVSLARSYGMEVSIGLEDASRADAKWLRKLALAAENAGAFRVRLSDTVGIWTPVKAMKAVSALRERLVIDIAVHCHDDFGMGTANAVAALDAGADWADGSLLGIGERSGLAATEELAGYFELIETSGNYRMEGVAPLCARIAQLADLPVPRNKAMVGNDIFACESGVHLHGMARDTSLFEPYAPESVRGSRRFGFSAKSGRSLLRAVLGEKTGGDADDLLERIGAHSCRTGRPLTMQECSDLAGN